MVIFHSYVSHYQRVGPFGPLHHFHIFHDEERDNEETRFLMSWEVFAKQSETFLLFSPDLNVARARTLAYFQEVEQDLCWSAETMLEP